MCYNITGDTCGIYATSNAKNNKKLPKLQNFKTKKIKLD